MLIILIALDTASLLLATTWSALRLTRSLHLLQLDSYSNSRLIKWLLVSPGERLFDYRLALLLLALLAVDVMLSPVAPVLGSTITLTAWIVVAGLLLARRKQHPAKKPLVYTARAKRILGVGGLLCAVIAIVFLLLALKQLFQGERVLAAYKSSLITLAGGLVVTQLGSLLVPIANLLLSPVQSAVNHRYIRSAKKKIADVAPVVIGVAGSYGKTSTKFFAETFLAERFRVLKSPKSFNTLMGLCRVINDNLLPEHQAFIAEMGAYRRGDVKELADLIRPHVGIITSIGPEHFERFKSMDNIKATNYELIESLPRSGIAIFNNDIEECRQLADRTQTVKVVRYGLDTSQPNLALWAEDVGMSMNGLDFTIADRNGNRAKVRVGLLGRHNVPNILGAACVGLEMGLSFQQIIQTIPKIKQVPHRLQLVPGGGGVTVIDDSYNSNPVGANEALNVLRAFTGGRRVLVTPGMVELGNLESEENEKLGAAAAKVCDYVVLVGMKQTKPLLRGLERERFPRERLRIVRDLPEATREIQKVLRPGDIVLFENDLPDLYEEF